MPAELTEPQIRVLAFVVRHWGETGWFPTFREIAAAMRFRSPNGVTCHLAALEKKGYLTRVTRAKDGKARARGILVPALDEGRKAVARVYLGKLERGAARA